MVASGRATWIASSHGYKVQRGLLQALRSQLGELVAGRKAFELTEDGRLGSLSARRSN